MPAEFLSAEQRTAYASVIEVPSLSGCEEPQVFGLDRALSELATEGSMTSRFEADLPPEIDQLEAGAERRGWALFCRF
jgi:hypothetical protein